MTHTIPLGEDRRADAPEQELGVAQGIIGPCPMLTDSFARLAEEAISIADC